MGNVVANPSNRLLSWTDNYVGLQRMCGKLVALKPNGLIRYSVAKLAAGTADAYDAS